MIARVDIAPDAIEGVAAGLSRALTKAQHEALLRVIAAHGMLVAANDDEAAELIRAVRDPDILPPAVRDRWNAVLVGLRKQNRFISMRPEAPLGLRSVVTLNDLRNGWRGRSEVAVLTVEQAARLGVDEEGLLVDRSAGIELATAPIAAYCGTFTNLRRLADEGHVSPGTRRDDFWRAVLAPIARASRHVTILDRYLFGGLAWHEENLPRSRSWDADTVVWLVEMLDRTMPSNGSVSLLGESPDEGIFRASDVADVIRSLWTATPSCRISSLNVTVSPWNQPGARLPHDRHIRFDAGVGIKLHAGWDRFRRATVTELDGVGWQYLWLAEAVQELRAAESRVRQHRDASTAAVLER